MSSLLSENSLLEIKFAMDRAEKLVGNDPQSAAQAFALVRSSVVGALDEATIKKISVQNEQVYVKERERHRVSIAARRQNGKGLVIFADSLGLPRLTSAGAEPAEERVYPELIADTLPDYAINSLCQRFFTTAHVRKELELNADLAANADVILHVGLNDCANRMFMENERLALGLLPDALSERIVRFSQQNRRIILTYLPPRHYVSPEIFSANLDTIIALLRHRGAKKIVLSTIILPPNKFWAATPFINKNFAAYNIEIMSVAHRHGALLLDIDRHIWRAEHLNPLLSDGMHLASEGHRIFAREAMAILRA